MPFFILLLGLLAPRVVIVLLWLFSDWFTGLYASAFIPVLGFILLPYTLLWHGAVLRFWAGEWGFWQVLFLCIALATDISSWLRSRP